MRKKPQSFKALFAVFFFFFLPLQLISVIAYFSDCQSNQKVLSSVVEKINQYQPTAIFIGGDITLNGSRQDEFTIFFNLIKPLTISAVIYPAMGNHDKDTELFLANFPQVDSLTYYSVEKDGILWIVLNSNLKLAPGSTQYNWLITTLEKYSNRTKVVVMHHPVFSSGAHGDEKGFSFLLPQLFSKYGVDLVLSGHDHIFERSEKDGVIYIVFGGAGGQLYNNVSRNDYSRLFKKTNGFLILDVIKDKLDITAIDLEGNTIDHLFLTIKK